MRGVGAGRSAQRGTSAAATGPRGARSAPPNPELVRTEKRLLFLVVQRFALRLLATAVAVLLASYLFPNLIIVESPARAVLFAIVLGILNAFLRPILLLLTLPLNLLTLGLFTFVVNGVVFWIASGFDLGVSAHDFGAAFLGALVVSAVSFVASRMLT
jgi:putative membrane protein